MPTGMPQAHVAVGAAIAVAVMTAIACLAIVGGVGDRTPRLERAQSLLADRTRFETGLSSGETLAKVAQHLERAVEDCRRDRLGVQCQALSAAFGYAQVLAARVLLCSAPGRLEARTRMARYLRQVGAVAPADGRVPSPPPLPSCGG